jgi:hypothetical protein
LGPSSSCSFSFVSSLPSFPGTTLIDKVLALFCGIFQRAFFQSLSWRWSDLSCRSPTFWKLWLAQLVWAISVVFLRVIRFMVDIVNVLFECISKS